MTFLECLQWLQDNGYARLIWPTCADHGTAHLSSEELVADAIAGWAARAERGRPQYFIEVELTEGGQPGAYVYPYPKPARLNGDVSIALHNGSVLPEDRLGWVKLWSDTCEECRGQGPCYSGPSYECVGLKGLVG